MNNVLKITKENNEARTNGGVLMVGRIMNKREVEAMNRQTTKTVDHDRFMKVVEFMHMEEPVVEPVIKEVVEDIDTSMFYIVNENSRRQKELNKRRIERQAKINKKEGIKSWITKIML